MNFWQRAKEKLGGNEAALDLSGTVERIDLELRNISLSQKFPNVTCRIPHGTWVLLQGKDHLSKAMFCDLCFGYLEPERGTIEPRLSSEQVNILGRGQNTFGVSLLDHLNFGIKNSSKEQVSKLAEAVFSENIRRHIDSNSVLMLKDHMSVSDARLNERDYMEISEINVLLQNRPMLVVDTTAVFYQNALDLGFRHSEVLLNSGKTIFWLLDDTYNFENKQSPWLRRTSEALQFNFDENTGEIH